MPTPAVTAETSTQAFLRDLEQLSGIPWIEDPSRHFRVTARFERSTGRNSTRDFIDSTPGIAVTYSGPNVWIDDTPMNRNEAATLVLHRTLEPHMAALVQIANTLGDHAPNVRNLAESLNTDRKSGTFPQPFTQQGVTDELNTIIQASAAPAFSAGHDAAMFNAVAQFVQQSPRAALPGIQAGNADNGPRIAAMREQALALRKVIDPYSDFDRHASCQDTILHSAARRVNSELDRAIAAGNAPDVVRLVTDMWQHGGQPTDAQLAPIRQMADALTGILPEGRGASRQPELQRHPTRS